MIPLFKRKILVPSKFNFYLLVNSSQFLHCFCSSEVSFWLFSSRFRYWMSSEDSFFFFLLQGRPWFLCLKVRCWFLFSKLQCWFLLSRFRYWLLFFENSGYSSLRCLDVRSSHQKSIVSPYLQKSCVGSTLQNDRS